MHIATMTILLDLKKELEISEFGIVEFPGYSLHFIQGQIALKQAGSLHKLRYNYHLLQRGEFCYMEIVPQFLNTSGEMKVEFIKNHITLTSVKNPDEKITLVREQIK